MKEKEKNKASNEYDEEEQERREERFILPLDVTLFLRGFLCPLILSSFTLFLAKYRGESSQPVEETMCVSVCSPRVHSPAECVQHLPIVSSFTSSRMWMHQCVCVSLVTGESKALVIQVVA